MLMANGFCLIDDKHVPLYRVIWISDTPHFCGADECTVEGRYEVRLEQGESVFGTRQERDDMLKALEVWQNGDPDHGEPWE
ncbi:MAG: hypothetical protein KDB14_28185 [Planctomycetales bacterium]|nr:hypothetical protein [Planctomycetales bacterium]